jgi:Arc/MetJ family transcription regulator
MRYIYSMTKHTSLYLDEDLLHEAGEILGTSGPTGTVRAALENVVRQARLKNLTTWEIEVTPAGLDASRDRRSDVAE